MIDSVKCFFKIQKYNPIKLADINILIVSRTNVASVGSVFNDTRKVQVLSLPETIKEKSKFPTKALHREFETSIFPLSFQVVRESLPFAYQYFDTIY